MELIITDLIDENQGDIMRLEDMLNRVRTGKKLYNSDKLYIEKLTPEIKKEISEEFEEPLCLDTLEKKMPKTKHRYYPYVVGILTAAFAIPVILYYGFGIELPIPSIR